MPKKRLPEWPKPVRSFALRFARGVTPAFYCHFEQRASTRILMPFRSGTYFQAEKRQLGGCYFHKVLLRLGGLTSAQNGAK